MAILRICQVAAMGRGGGIRSVEEYHKGLTGRSRVENPE